MGYRPSIPGLDYTAAAGAGSGDVTLTGAQTLTNKRITARVVSVAYAASVTPNADTTDVLIIGALTGNLTIATPSGTPTDKQKLEVQLLQDGTGGRTLTLGSGFVFPTSSTLSSPLSQTDFVTASALTVLLLEYSATRSKWLVVSFVPGY